MYNRPPLQSSLKEQVLGNISRSSFLLKDCIFVIKDVNISIPLEKELEMLIAKNFASLLHKPCISFFFCWGWGCPLKRRFSYQNSTVQDVILPIAMQPCRHSFE